MTKANTNKRAYQRGDVYMQEWYRKMIKDRVDMIEDELFLKRIFIIVNDYMIKEKRLHAFD